MRTGIIQREMSEGDIWLVTDIRISPTTKGISLKRLKSLLPHYEFVSCRTYEFFGDARSELPDQFRAREDQLVSSRSSSGALFAGAWKLVSH
jgi:hypothetical protein